MTSEEHKNESDNDKKKEDPNPNSTKDKPISSVPDEKSSYNPSNTGEYVASEIKYTRVSNPTPVVIERATESRSMRGSTVVIAIFTGVLTVCNIWALLYIKDQVKIANNGLAFAKEQDSANRAAIDSTLRRSDSSLALTKQSMDLSFKATHFQFMPTFTVDQNPFFNNGRFKIGDTITIQMKFMNIGKTKGKNLRVVNIGKINLGNNNRFEVNPRLVPNIIEPQDWFFVNLATIKPMGVEDSIRIYGRSSNILFSGVIVCDDLFGISDTFPLCIQLSDARHKMLGFCSRPSSWPIK